MRCSSAGVECRGLAAARRPGHENDAVRQVEQARQLVAQTAGEPEPLEIEIDRRTIQDAEHDALAVQRGDRRNAQIDLVAADDQLDPPVLGQSPFGDVELRHDLDARHDGRLKPARWSVDLVQHAIIAIADAQAILERIEMNVGGARLHATRDQLIDQSDQRRFAGEILEALGVVLERDFGAAREIGRCGLAGAVAVSVEPLECRLEIDRKGDRDLDASSRGRSDRRVGETIERIGERERDRSLVQADRQRSCLAQEFRAQALGQDRRVRIILRCDKLQSEDLRRRLREGAVADQAKLGEYVI